MFDVESSVVYAKRNVLPQMLWTGQSTYRFFYIVVKFGLNYSTFRLADKGQCYIYYRTASASISPIILHSYGNINFQYPGLYDPDRFPAKNLDVIYYRDDAVGIIGVPDVPWKEERRGTLTFEGIIPSSPLVEMDLQSYNHRYTATITSEKMSPYTHTIENGDMLSAHYTPDLLGILDVQHASKLYNIDRYIGEYTGVAQPLIVVYDPQITDTSVYGKVDYQSSIFVILSRISSQDTAP